MEQWIDLGESNLSDLALQAIFVYFIVFKLSPLFFSFHSIRSNPQSMLFLTGTSKEVLVAALVTALYLWILARRKQIPLMPLLDAIALVAVFSFAGYQLIFRDLGKVTTMPWGLTVEGGRYEYHPLNYYRFLFLALLVLFWRQKNKKWIKGESFQFLLVFGGLGLLFISYLDYEPPSSNGLTFEQWIYALAATLGWIQGLMTKRVLHRLKELSK
ncbi:hypothetical protein [Thermoactinomyces mirandus]|uniref:Prolipoprotein diacylglyceryl transferase n=1 Tax=Thermoactinomyces mirandus TaxID=2756294 RepID=A0A7W1XRY0_9BACL|nr:hypothetical protein [Thermoactinomyces mirandus]MBA4601930.1 hypothetical protein [Thermoactinomyces mirandus]